MKSKIISISAISAGFVALFLCVGSYLSIVEIFSTVVASAFVILPLYYKSYKGCFLAYLVGGAISLLVCIPSILYSFVIPAYFVFFGIYPIIKNIFIDKNINKYLSFVVGLIWCVATIYGVFFYYTLIMGLQINGLPYFISKNVLIFLAPVGILFFLIYDRFVVVCKYAIDKYLNRIIK